MRKIISVVFILISFNIAQAQIGNVLKKAAKSALKSDAVKNLVTDKVADELDDIRSEYDSSSFNYAIALSDNAGLFESKEKYERHKKFLIEGFKKRTDNMSDEDQARGWIDRAEILYASGKYKLAAGFLLSALAYYETEGKTNSIDYAKALANLGLVAHSGGRYTYSMDFTTRSMELREELFGKDSKGYAASLNNYALLIKDLGQYNKAEKLLSEAVVLNKKAYGSESVEYAITLNNQGVLNQALGRIEQAEELFLQAINISEEHLKEKSANYQQLQTNLALLYQETGRYDEAEQIYLNAIELRKKRLGAGHPDYAHMLVNLASLYMDMGKYDEVEENLKEARNIYLSKLGENSPSTASAIADLGNFYRFRGRYEEALPLLKQAKDIRRTTLGNEHPDYVQSLEDLAIIYGKSEKVDVAIENYETVMEQTMSFINEYFLPMSENEKTKYWNKIRPRFQRFYSFGLDHYKEYPELSLMMYNYHLATKAILLSASNKIREEILNSNDEELIQKYTEWLDQKESLAKYYTYSKEEIEQENINLDSLENAANDSERFLSENSKVFGDEINKERIQFHDLTGVLQNDEAAIEIIRVNKFENSFTDEIQYLGLIAGRGSEKPDVVSLKNGSDLEGKYFKYYNNVIKQKMGDEYSYGFYWEPVEKHLQGIEHAFISVDGVYNQINIGTLRDNEGNYVVDKLNITILGNTKDLLRIKGTVQEEKNTNAKLFGYPLYGGDGSISMLPGTKTELEEISKILSSSYTVNTYMEEIATEENIKNIESPGLLHIATHGFFLEDVGNKSKVFGVQTEKAKDNPLLRSGLLFTDAGKTALGEVSNSLSGSNNGVLTAFEAIGLPLNNTKLVVLSACETGLGDVKAGEGVYGLQRSFLMAGADALIMSLWKVDDDATQKLMTEFYKEWAQDGKELETAFAQAQKSLKNEYPHPYYWGAFVLVRR